jgi:hypothetical protein
MLLYRTKPDFKSYNILFIIYYYQHLLMMSFLLYFSEETLSKESLKRLEEFKLFEQKFEECISASAIKTKFDGHLSRGLPTISLFIDYFIIFLLGDVFFPVYYYSIFWVFSFFFLFFCLFNGSLYHILLNWFLFLFF